MEQDSQGQDSVSHSHKWAIQICLQHTLAFHPFMWSYVKQQENREGYGGHAWWLEGLTELVWKSQSPSGSSQGSTT